MNERAWPKLPKRYFFRLGYWLGNSPRLELRKKTFLGFSTLDKWALIHDEEDIKYYSERWAASLWRDKEELDWFKGVLENG